MQENFLHFLWRYQRFDQKHLATTQGEAISILNLGEYNTHAGPDFFNARLQIGNTIWAGNVEMHLLSSDWKKHKHQTDTAYDNVILHVVLEEDEPIFRQNGERIPCLEIKKHIPPKISKTYQKIEQNKLWIPCQHLFHQVPALSRTSWLDRVLVERLEQKTQAIQLALNKSNNDWEEVFYQFLARNFGVKVNAEPFAQLAHSVSLKTITKHKDNLLQIEALLFGQAALLEEDLEEAYPQLLQKEYRFLKQKHGLHSIPKESWKFMRMRPANFPTIRIAQLARLLFQSHHLFSKMLAAKNVKEIENMFELQISNYWLTHYTFGKESPKRKKSLGKSTIYLFIINTIAPFLFLYGQIKDDHTFKDRALQLLEELPAEKNSIITKWQELGVETSNASHTQALLQLKNEFCKPKRCLECGIGNVILK